MEKMGKLFFGPRLINPFAKGNVFGEDIFQLELLDLLFLSKCKELILTPYSSFGSVAAGFGKIRPHFVTRKDGICFKDVSYEPKANYWHSMVRFGAKGHAVSDFLNNDEVFL